MNDFSNAVRERIGRFAKRRVPCFGHVGPYFIGTGLVVCDVNDLKEETNLSSSSRARITKTEKRS